MDPAVSKDGSIVVAFSTSFCASNCEVHVLDAMGPFSRSVIFSPINPTNEGRVNWRDGGVARGGRGEFIVIHLDTIQISSQEGELLQVISARGDSKVAEFAD